MGHFGKKTKIYKKGGIMCKFCNILERNKKHTKWEEKLEEKDRRVTS